MNRLLNWKVTATLGAIGIGLAVGDPVQAQNFLTTNPLPPMTSLPVTGGQFSVDLQIQNGQVQEYRYTNNQLPTLLTPVGTIGIINATMPVMSYQKFDQSPMFLAPEAASEELNASQPKPITAVLQVTGNTQLNDGRTADFQNTNAFLLGSATASSAFPLGSLEMATDPITRSYYNNWLAQENRDRVPGGSQYWTDFHRPLPPSYQGSINVKITEGSIVIPNSAFSAASPSQTSLALTSGNQELIIKGNRSLSSRIITPEEVGSYGVSFLEDSTFGSNSTNDIQGNLSNGEVSLKLTHVTRPQYYSMLSPLLPAYDGTIQPGSSVTGIANGTVKLANGQTVTVQDRLINLYHGYGDNYDYKSDTFLRRVFGGELYIDPTAVIPPPTAQPITAPEAPVEVIPVITPEPTVTALSDTTIANFVSSSPTQNPVVRPSSPLPSQNEIADIMSSPLSSSRIFPDMGALR